MGSQSNKCTFLKKVEFNKALKSKKKKKIGKEKKED